MALAFKSLIIPMVFYLTIKFSYKAYKVVFKPEQVKVDRQVRRLAKVRRTGVYDGKVLEDGKVIYYLGKSYQDRIISLDEWQWKAYVSHLYNKSQKATRPIEYT